MTVKLFLNLLLLHFMPLMETSQGLLSCNIIICMTARKLFRVTWLIINPKIFLHFFLFGVPKDTSNQWRSSGGTKKTVPLKKVLVPRLLQGVPMWIPNQNTEKAFLLRAIQILSVLLLKKESEKKKLKSLFILKKRVLQFYSVLN